MRIILIISGVLLAVALVVLQQSLAIAPADAVAAVMRWPVAQQLAVIAIACVFVFLLSAGLWQSGRIARQTQALEILQNRMSGLRDDISAAGDEQGGADAAVRHLVGTDPVTIVDDVQQRLAEAETRTAQQAAQNEAVDLQSRIDDIRNRQQTLRTQLGSVSEKRRVIEPMLGEVKERQGLIERALGDLEKDENGRNLDSRLEEAEAFLNRGHTRLDALETMFVKLTQLRERMEKLQGDIAPLKHADSGMKALFNEVVTLQSRADAALLSLEKQDDEAIGDRLDRLSKRKADIEQRIAALNDSFGSLEAVRRDIGEHFEKLNASLGSHLK